MPDMRTSERGNVFDSTLIHAFIRHALDHDAVEQDVMSLLHEHVVGGRYHPSVVADSLRPMIDEILDTATTADWNRVAADLITEAREALQPTEETATP